MNEQQEIIKTKQYIEALTKREAEKYTRLKYMPIKVTYSNRMKRAICTTIEKMVCGRAIAIEFRWSNNILKKYYSNLKLIKAIFYHELAHAIVGGQHGHDKVWQAVADELGGIAKRSVSCKDY